MLDPTWKVGVAIAKTLDGLEMAGLLLANWRPFILIIS